MLVVLLDNEITECFRIASMPEPLICGHVALEALVVEPALALSLLALAYGPGAPAVHRGGDTVRVVAEVLASGVVGQGRVFIPTRVGALELGVVF